MTTLSVELVTLLFFGSLLVFLFIGTPLVFTLGGISVIFLYFTMGSVGFYIVASKFWDSMMSFTLIAIPMYVYMAMLLEKSGVAQDLYRMMHVWFGGMRGGLAIGTVAICAIFAAMSGISGAAVVTMGTIALPRMLERGYDKRLAVGAINCGGGWGILIPPSILMVLYALLTGEAPRGSKHATRTSEAIETSSGSLGARRRRTNSSPCLITRRAKRRSARPSTIRRGGAGV